MCKEQLSDADVNQGAIEGMTAALELLEVGRAQGRGWAGCAVVDGGADDAGVMLCEAGLRGGLSARMMWSPRSLKNTKMLSSTFHHQLHCRSSGMGLVVGSTSQGFKNTRTRDLCQEVV